MSSNVFRANFTAILDFELRYTKMLKDARVASNGFLIRTSESTDFTKKTLDGRQVQVVLILHYPSARLHIEYCVQAWSPYLERDIDMLERVQRSATRLLSGFAKYSYEDRLRKLGITTLRRRRERGDLIGVYRLMSGKKNVEKTQFFRQARCEYNLRGHSLRVGKKRSRLDIRKYSFSQRVVNGWNRLPQNIVDARSINQFKNLLDRHFQDMDVMGRTA